MANDLADAAEALNCEIPQVSPNQMKRAIRRFKNVKKSWYIESDPGVGKSFIVNEMAKELGRNLIDRRASGWSPDTAAGTLMQDVESMTTLWFPPEWLQIRTDRPNLYFFDEFSAAHDMVRKPLLGWFLERFLNHIKAGDDDMMFAAGNIGTLGTIVQHMDNATLGRFMKYQMVASLEQWVPDFAAIHNVHPGTVAYLRHNPGYFCMTEVALKNDLRAYGNPRNWTSFSDLIWEVLGQTDGKLPADAREELVWGGGSYVGKALAEGCVAMVEQTISGHTLLDLLEASDAERAKMWPKTAGELHTLIFSMMSYPQTLENAKRVMKLADAFPTDSELPFQDMRTPTREVIMQKLRRNGVAEHEVTEAFAEESNGAMAAMRKTGRPFISLRNAA